MMAISLAKDSISLHCRLLCRQCWRLRTVNLRIRTTGAAQSARAGALSSRHVHTSAHWYTLNNGKDQSTITGTTDTGSLRQGSSNVESGPSGLEPGMRSEASEGEAAKIQLQPSPEELKKSEPWMEEELEAYYFGRKRLAEMMGEDPETFTDKDVEEALRYLLPTRLTARDARPFLKHPFEIFPKRKEAVFDVQSGRPLEPAFYTGFPAYHNLIYKIFQQSKFLEEAELQAVQDAGEPQVSEAEWEVGEDEEGLGGVADSEEGSQDQPAPMYWVKKSTLSDMLAAEVSDTQYDDLVARLSKLADHPLSEEIKDFLDQYRKPVFIYRSQANVPKMDKQGRVQATGKRKTSAATVTVVRGSGRVTVNGREFIDYFPRLEDRQQVLYPLMVADQLGLYDVSVMVKGGGVTGQAGAIRLGLSKALLAFPGDHGNILEKAGLLVRDSRAVERKKPGQKKARKKFTWVKR